MPTFEFNVASVTKFAYIAAAYLQIGNESRNTDKGIIFLGSVAALVPPPDSPFYNVWFCPPPDCSIYLLMLCSRPAKAPF